jgi:hypothetical protein
MNIYPTFPTGYPLDVTNFLNCPLLSMGDDCAEFNIGGIDKIWLIEKKDINNVYNLPTGEVNLINTTGIFKVFYSIFFNKNSASYKSTLNLAKDGKYHNGTLSFELLDWYHRDRNILFNLIKKELTGIIKTNNNLYILVGWPNGLELSSYEYITGQSKSDKPRISVTFQEKNKRRAPLILSSALNNLLFSEVSGCNENYQPFYVNNQNCNII